MLKRLIELGLVFIDKPRAAPPDEWSETLRAAVDRDIRLAACDGVLSRDAIFRIQDKHNVQDAFTQVLDNGLAYSNLKGEIVDAEHRRKEREDWIASRERQRTGSADWKSNLVPMGCMALIVFVALYVVISIAGGGSPQTPQQRLEQQMKEGQRDVCRKWGSLADGC